MKLTDDRSMTPDEFNQLVNGPLSHPLPMFSITRLALALWAVVEATGPAGAEALRSYCKDRDERDGANE